MPFKHIVDKKKNIVVLKATAESSIMDIVSEIQKAINTKRGEGLTRRLIDMSGQNFTYSLEDAQKILKMMKIHSQILGSRKVAVLLKKIPDNPYFQKISSLMNSSALDMKFFIDKAKAAQFLNQ